MGMINHNAVIAITSNADELARAKKFIASSGEAACLFSVVPAFVNGYTTIALCPDGGNESGDISCNGDDLRESFIEMLEENKYTDGSSSWKWVEVSFGEFGQRIVQGNNKNVYE